MNYDEKIKRAETIIAQLEQAEALASEAEALLNQCKEELTTPYATYDGKPEER